MKKPDHSSRPPGGRGGKNPRRPQQDHTQKPGGSFQQNRTNSRKRNAQASQMWINASSQTLTSHIQMVGKRMQDNQGKNPTAKNGGGKFQGKDQQGGSRTGRDKFKKYNPANRQERAPGHQPQPRSAVNSTPVEASPLPTSSTEPKKTIGNIDPFELFCAYHLGIRGKNEYRPSNINEVASRFGVDPATIRQVTKEYAMDSASLLDRDFDMSMAQLDIQVAPEGINRIELARSIYEDFLNAPIQKRDWTKLLEEDRKENRKIFGS